MDIHQNRQQLRIASATNQPSIGFEPVSGRISAQEAFEQSEDFGTRAAEATRAYMKSEMSEDRIKDLDWRQKGNELSWAARGIQLDEKYEGKDTLEAYAARKEHEASGFYAVSDLYADQAQSVLDVAGKQDDYTYRGFVSRAAELNNNGIRAHTHAIVATSGLEGLMAHTGRDYQSAMALVKETKAGEIKTQFEYAQAGKNGASIDGLRAPEEIKAMLESKDPEAANQVRMLREAALIEAFPRGYQGEDATQKKVQAAALRTTFAEEAANPLNESSRALRNADKALIAELPRDHAFSKTLRSVRVEMQDRAAQKEASQDVR